MKKILSILAVAILAACAANSNMLDSKSFTITELNGTEYVAMGEDAGTISFQEGRCNVYLGGNQIFAEYKECANGAISFGEAGATKMFVPDSLREDEFLAAFAKVSSFEMDETGVSFKDAQGNVLFKASK